uniref:Uncharacterized protein n=1 Tax=viral metagenome TaxID=1070528 RepID=A0A6C0EM52_9ZZZZ
MSGRSKRSNRYVFSLYGVNIEKVEQKYGIGSSNILLDEDIPKNTTKLDDLDIVKKTPEVVSFLDESKQIRKCTVSMIDFRTGKNIRTSHKYKCFWDRNFIPDEYQPLGCPIRFVPSRATKSYLSEITKDRYTISEHITRGRKEELKKNKDVRITLDEESYYETDGAFCSFNCMMNFIQENKRDPLYRYSESLAKKMYYDIHGEYIDEILAAPHWRELKEYGGDKEIAEFRNSFNKVEHIDHGVITMVSLGRLFEDRIKF